MAPSKQKFRKNFEKTRVFKFFDKRKGSIYVYQQFLQNCLICIGLELEFKTMCFAALRLLKGRSSLPNM